MTSDKRSQVEDLRGSSRLAVEATKGVMALVEEMHRTIGAGPAILGRPFDAPVRLITGMVYGRIRDVTSVVGAGIDWALGQLAPLLGDGRPGLEREAVRAAINGVLGDYLRETNNPLAIDMRLRLEGLTAHVPASQKLLVMVHGSCMNDRQWCRAGHDHGVALANELGYELAYLHYNSGQHISTNGNEFAVLLEKLVAEWPAPLDDIAIVGYSMGGLVARSACYTAERQGLEWRAKLRSLIFLGTPHHGAPLERGGNLVDVLLGISRYSEPLARLGKIRSAGVTDMRFGNVLDEHWQGRDRFASGGDTRSPLPLPEGVPCYAIAGTSSIGLAGKLRGDGLVTVDSALGRSPKPDLDLAIPESHTSIVSDARHLDLLNHPLVYQTLRSWLS